MADDELSIGQRFAHVYLERDKPLQDSARFRFRLGSFLEQMIGAGQRADRLAMYLRREIGTHVYGIYLQDFFEKAELRDALDAITLVWVFFGGDGAPDTSGRWKLFVERALREENLGYRLDDRAGVHPFVDDEFERNRVASIAALQRPEH